MALATLENAALFASLSVPGETDPSGALSAPIDEFASLPIQLTATSSPPFVEAEPEHHHFHFRFVFQGEPDQLTAQQDEVSACAWVSADMPALQSATVYSNYGSSEFGFCVTAPGQNRGCGHLSLIR